MCNGPDHMFQDHDLGVKSHNHKLSKSRKNLRLGIFGIVSVFRDLTEATIVHSLCTGGSESLRFPLLFSFPDRAYRPTLNVGLRLPLPSPYTNSYKRMLLYQDRATLDILRNK